MAELQYIYSKITFHGRTKLNLLLGQPVSDAQWIALGLPAVTATKGISTEHRDGSLPCFPDGQEINADDATEYMWTSITLTYDTLRAFLAGAGGVILPLDTWLAMRD
jgi:hypothetical protein